KPPSCLPPGLVPTKSMRELSPEMATLPSATGMGCSLVSLGLVPLPGMPPGPMGGLGRSADFLSSFALLHPQKTRPSPRARMPPNLRMYGLLDKDRRRAIQTANICYNNYCVNRKLDENPKEVDKPRQVLASSVCRRQVQAGYKSGMLRT